jgi:hypothetical protein
MHIEVEYLGGPVCGRREVVPAGRDNLPGPFRIVPVPERYDSALDDGPAVPAEDHTYRRAAPADSGVWIYTWSGSLH